ncbi:cell surface protein [Bifidobacterium goeldii]|uniref:Cell surface protein n=1 Tax=Bifidobacterium goeldii TaxID=2306975 RepID=A0A430FJX1_9BIFI|nr:cell surface protein [Bifidobacterium goeldii]RSX53179.1 cell surface protein [Bifidobacterium goeldii]
MADTRNEQRGIAARLCGILLTCMVMLTVLTFTAFTTPTRIAQAATVGSITIDARWDRESANPVPLAGDTYAIVRIASADIDANGAIAAYHTLDRFADYDRAWGSLTASGANAAAQQLATFVGAQDQYDASRIVNESGFVTFSGLEAGVYLVTRTGIADANAAYHCDPFLTYVPGTTENGGILWNVVVEPKFGYDNTENPPSPPEPGTPEKPGTPDTPGTPSDNTGNTPTVTEQTARTGAAIVVPITVGFGALVFGLVLMVARHRQR